MAIAVAVGGVEVERAVAVDVCLPTSSCATLSSARPNRRVSSASRRCVTSCSAASKVRVTDAVMGCAEDSSGSRRVERGALGEAISRE